MKSKQLRRLPGILITEVAIMIAKIDANSTCAWLGYQPELPKNVKKLRKF